MSAFILDQRIKDSTHHLIDLKLCTLLIKKDANFYWFLLVPQKSNARNLLDLSAEESALLWQEINIIYKALDEYFKPTKINVAAIGNIVEQLHIHLIVRYADDPLFPQTVWDKQLPEKLLALERLQEIRDFLSPLSLRAERGNPEIF